MHSMPTSGPAVGDRTSCSDALAILSGYVMAESCHQCWHHEYGCQSLWRHQRFFSLRVREAMNTPGGLRASSLPHGTQEVHPKLSITRILHAM